MTGRVLLGDWRDVLPGSYGSALWIVEGWTDDGWTVVDPFAGTGTIGRAAAALGHDYIGAEIVPAWHAEAVESIRSSRPSLGL